MEHELEDVFRWLEAGETADYQAGVLLLQRHSRNRGLVSLLLKKESVAHREKLVYELVKVGCGGRIEDVSEVLNHFAQAVQGAVPPVTNPPVVPDPGPAEQVEAAPAVRAQADEWTEQLARLYNQRCQLSNSLADLAEAEAPPVVAEILRLEAAYNVLSQKQRRLLAGAQTCPEPLAPEADEPAGPSPDRAGLVLRRNTLRSSLSKARKKAEESKTEEKRSEYAQKAGRLQVELDQVEMQLKA